MEEKLRGIIVPLLTPLTSDGSLDELGLERLIGHCADHGADGIFILGSCGEGSCFTSLFRRKVVAKTLEIVGDQLPVLVGVLDNATGKVMDEIHALETMNIEYFVVTAPYYLQPDCEQDMYNHFHRIAAATSRKIVLYNIPGFTHSEISPETILRLCRDMENIVAIKDSTSSWPALQRKLLLKDRDDLNILCGHEELCGAGMLFGGDGCVPCFANPYPALFAQMFKAAMTKDVPAVQRFQAEIFKMRKLLENGHWIAVLKYLCSRSGFIHEYTSPSVPALSPEQMAAIERALADIDLTCGGRA